MGILRWAASWLLFCIGDMSDRWLNGFAYQQAMRWSVRVQGDGYGPWKLPEEY
jgi:hypothetical protein